MSNAPLCTTTAKPRAGRELLGRKCQFSGTILGHFTEPFRQAGGMEESLDAQK